jgi:hypothetical protein
VTFYADDDTLRVMSPKGFRLLGNPRQYALGTDTMALIEWLLADFDKGGTLAYSHNDGHFWLVPLDHRHAQEPQDHEPIPVRSLTLFGSHCCTENDILRLLAKEKGKKTAANRKLREVRGNVKKLQDKAKRMKALREETP